MDTKSLLECYPKFLEQLYQSGHHPVTVSRFRAEIKRIIKFGSVDEVKSFSDYYERMYGEYRFGVPGWKSKEKRCLIQQIQQYVESGICPSTQYHRTNKTPLPYDLLNEEARQLVDCAVATRQKRNLAPTTIHTDKLCFSRFLMLLYKESGVNSIAEITEDMILCFFDKSKNPRYCRASTNRLKRSLLDIEEHPLRSECCRIANYFPKVPQIRRMYVGLSEDNQHKVEAYILDESNDLPHRDRAILLLLYYIGLRRSDIANLRIENIDWQHQLINIVQVKTNVELHIKMEPILGNAIYQYILQERPKVDNPYIFIARDTHNRSITPGIVSALCCRVFGRLGITTKDCRLGSHVFRHKLATDLLETQIPIPTISAILGHTNAISVNHYVGTTYQALKSCSLSIHEFPIRKEVLA